VTKSRHLSNLGHPYLLVKIANFHSGQESTENMSAILNHAIRRQFGATAARNMSGTAAVAGEHSGKCPPEVPMAKFACFCKVKVM